MDFSSFDVSTVMPWLVLILVILLIFKLISAVIRRFVAIVAAMIVVAIGKQTGIFEQISAALS